MTSYPNWFRSFVIAALALLVVTGLLLLPTFLDLQLEWDVPWRLPGGARVGVAALHVGLAFLVAALFGSLWRAHMRAGWKRRRNRLSGSLMAGTLIVLAASGLGVFYFGDEDLSFAASLVHAGLGLGIPLLLITHIVAARRLAKLDGRPRRRRRGRRARTAIPVPVAADSLAEMRCGRGDTLH